MAARKLPPNRARSAFRRSRRRQSASRSRIINRRGRSHAQGFDLYLRNNVQMAFVPSGGSNAPTLDTERLRLRGHRAEDLEECAKMWADPEVVRFIGGRPFTR